MTANANCTCCPAHRDIQIEIRHESLFLSPEARAYLGREVQRATRNGKAT